MEVEIDSQFQECLNNSSPDNLNVSGDFIISMTKTIFNELTI